MGRTNRQNCTAMAMHDSLGRGQADAYAGELVLPVEALERLKEFFGVGHVEAGAVICDAEKVLTLLLFSINSDNRFSRAGGVFPGVVEQVSHDHFDHESIPPCTQAGFDPPLHPALRLRFLQFTVDAISHYGEVNPVVAQFSTGAARQGEQAIYQLAHVPTAEDDLVEVFARLYLKFVAIIFNQGFAEAAHCPEWCTQVVGDRVGKGLQFLVRALKLRNGMIQFLIQQFNLVGSQLPDNDILLQGGMGLREFSGHRVEGHGHIAEFILGYEGDRVMEIPGADSRGAMLQVFDPLADDAAEGPGNNDHKERNSDDNNERNSRSCSLC